MAGAAVPTGNAQSRCCFVGRRLSRRAIEYACCGSVLAAFLFSLGTFEELIGLPEGHRTIAQAVFDWLPVTSAHMTHGRLSGFGAEWAFQIDPLSVVMLLVVTGVGISGPRLFDRVHGRREGLYRYFGCMNLFVFAMLTLVMAANLVVLFVGWEGVGLCSYLLIRFLFSQACGGGCGEEGVRRQSRGRRGLFAGNIFDVGDAGNNSIYEDMAPALAAGHFTAGNAAITAIALLLFAGATGKSAQIPLYIWLPDAMEGPTPVSALIHAATMVTAGVYIVARTSVIFAMAPVALLVVAIVGAMTALLAASMALVQTDIKKVSGVFNDIAARIHVSRRAAVGAFAAGIFHLMTHAFFKSLLFLGCGQRDSRSGWRTGFAQDGRAGEEAAGDVLGFDDRGAGDIGRVSVRGISEQGPDFEQRV